MVFSSTLFLLIFLPIFLLGYHLLPHKLRNCWILIASLIFYSWGAPIFIFVVVGSVIVDFFLIDQLHRSRYEKRRKWLLALSISINLGLLLYFKYANFFVENVNLFLENLGFRQLEWVKVGLPVGISFYTFQTLTYSVDVYRRVHPPFKNPLHYLVYILLFPQMIAGPIVRFNIIADQIENREALETIDHKLVGLFRFIIGLSKKVLIANVVGAEADLVFSQATEDLSTKMAWIGIIAYSFQIYFDFSGYSDMAIGIGRMLGFTFPENFNNPYTSKNITEFWRRWHITLGAFMRDYLYIPLGGSRVSSKSRMFFNLWLVFLLSGLWHGAAWNFIVWGIFHGAFLILDRLFLIRLTEKMGKLPSVLLTFFIVLIGWVFFRSETLDQAFDYLEIMFSIQAGVTNHFYSSEFIAILLIAIFFSFITLSKHGRNIEQYVFQTNSFTGRKTLSWAVIGVGLLILSIGSILSSEFNPFIYFRF